MKNWLLTLPLLFGAVGIVQGGQAPSVSARLPDVAANVAELKRLEAYQSAPIVVASAAQAPVQVAGAAAEPEQAAKFASTPAKPTSHRAELGDTLSKIGVRFGYDWRVLCAFNRVPNCNRIMKGQVILFPAPGTVVAKPLQAKPAETSCIHIGVAPFNPENDLARTLQGIDLLTKLTPEKKELAKRKVVLSEKATENELVGQQIFTEMLYQSTKVGKKVEHVYGKPICSSEQGGQPEVMDTYDLGDGDMFSLPRRCKNPSLFTKTVVKPSLPIVVPGPAPAASAPPPKASAPLVVSDPPDTEEVEVVVSDYDSEDSFYIGGDRDVKYAGGEGAFYPKLTYYDWGRHALGFGGSFGLWNGGTPDGFEYSGETACLGLAQKFSWNSRRDLGIKFPMICGLWERGHDKSGAFQEKGRASLASIAANYTDASREKDGKFWFPEWQVWGNYGVPYSQTNSQSWFHQQIETSSSSDIKSVAGLGVRVIIAKNLGDQGLLSKVQPFAEIGLNRTAPNPLSGHIYGGLRTTDKVWTGGVGMHWSKLLGKVVKLPGATITYDEGRHRKLRYQEARWSEMVEGLKALGVAVD